jgi:hypothetical protein
LLQLLKAKLKVLQLKHQKELQLLEQQDKLVMLHYSELLLELC